MKRADLWCVILVAGVAAAVATGCDTTKTLDTVPVTGKVTLDGEPVAGATVTFIPVNREQGVSATGKTDENGVYKLTAVGVEGDVEVTPGSGTVPGEYQVTVTKNITPEIPQTPEEYEEWTESTSESEVQPASAQQITYVVPRRYNRPQTSGLQVTVKDGENDIPLELTSE